MPFTTSASASAVLHPRVVLYLLRTYWRHWVVPALVVAVAGTAYALFRSPTWEASQALILRNEATNSDTPPGKFRQPEDMKTLQETILELVRGRKVLEPALKAVGPPAGYKQAAEAWPTPRDIADARDAIKLDPPKGAEFGKTEVFYLEVKQKDRQRAIALCEAVGRQLQLRLQELRNAQAQSMIDELTRTVEVARADLDNSTAELTKVEASVGGDLAELRGMGDAVSSETALQRTLTEIRSELRTIHAARQENIQLLAALKAAENDPGRLLAAPNSLFESQPALRRLKDGLVDSQLHTSQLAGKMTDDHPLMQAAKESENEIGRHLHDELAIAVRGMEMEITLDEQREELLGKKLAETTARLDHLASVRAAYSNLAAENKHRAELMERAEQNLSEARAAHASAKASSLIASIDAADTGPDPVGPGRATIVLLSCLGGLLLGGGVLMLTVSPEAVQAAVQKVLGSAAGTQLAPSRSAEGSRYPRTGEAAMAPAPASAAIAAAVTAAISAAEQTEGAPISFRQALERLTNPS